MEVYDETYEPREDSYLLQKYVKKYAKGRVLDMGTGSGIQAKTAAMKKQVKKILAIDISKKVIEERKKNDQNNKIEFKQSDLFEYVPLTKFDTIIFNPPYLPQDLQLKDLTIFGGRKGYETVHRFLKEVPLYLKTNGSILLLFSSLTRPEKVHEFLEMYLLDHTLLEKMHISFEDLFVYKIEKSKLLQGLEKKSLRSITLLKKGNRGIVYKAAYKKKVVAIKVENPESKAIDRIKNEINWLKLLNKKGIGPQLIFVGKNYLAMEYLDGLFIMDYLKQATKKQSEEIIRNLLDQCYLLDSLKVNKDEMQRPYKHVIVSNHKPVFLDFERCKISRQPKNVSQFLQFLTSSKVKDQLQAKGIIVDADSLRELTGIYKKNQTRKAFDVILGKIRFI